MSKFTDFLKSALGKKKEESAPVAKATKATKTTSATPKAKKAPASKAPAAAKTVRKASGRGK